VNIIGVSRIHNSSVAVVKDGDLVFHSENERYSNIKYDSYPFHLIHKLPDIVDDADVIALAGTGPTVPAECFTEQDVYTTAITRLNKNYLNKDIKVFDLWHSHHMLHAAHAFYNSGFDEAVCIIKDGMGSDYPLYDDQFEKDTYGRENGSVFKAKYPAEFEQVSKDIIVPFECDIKINTDTKVNNNVSEALAFQKTSQHFGFHELDAGKVMGMASYGVEDHNLPEIFIDGKINTDLFSMKEQDVRTVYLNTQKYPYLDTKDFQIKANFARKLQLETQAKVKQDIIDAVRQTQIKNIVLAGGFFLNCVANYEYIEGMPEDVNIYIEPVSSDAGTSIGAAKIIWHTLQKDTTKRPITSLYNGYKHTMEVDRIKKTYNTLNYQTVDIKTVAELIADRNIVAMYQGQAESGPRALGNRSILYDPRDPDGKDKVNTIKNREWFRPFAGSVLEEHANDWFDLRGLKDSPYMMYAVKTKQDKIDKIPAINHIDNTSRVQTVNVKQNKNFYNLIKEFNNITGVPILFNTSFNLAGDCIVETVDDAVNTFKNSCIDHLYFPEQELLVSKNGK
jgi:carbamoyltransferase